MGKVLHIRELIQILLDFNLSSPQMTALGDVWQSLSILETRTILQAIAGLMQGRSGEKGGEGRGYWAWCLWNWHHTHGISETGSRTPPCKHYDQVTSLEESTSFADIHA